MESIAFRNRTSGEDYTDFGPARGLERGSPSCENRPMSRQEPRYRSLASWLRELYGTRVHKITVDAGLGCPNRDGTKGFAGCIYCNPRGSGTGAASQGLGIREQVERGINFLSRRYQCTKFIAYFQSFSNTYAPPLRLAKLYGEALERPEIVGLAIGTRPDCVSDDVLDLLADLGRDRLIWVEYGLQSVHERTLELIKRGHGPGDFFDAVKRTKARGITVVAHLILGLPGESFGDMVETARAVSDAGVDGVKLHPLYVIRGTALEDMFRSGKYTPMTLEESVRATLGVMRALPSRVVIHRMTSDPHPEELIAPLWMLDRKEVRKSLDAAMAASDFRQGMEDRLKSVAGSPLVQEK